MSEIFQLAMWDQLENHSRFSQVPQNVEVIYSATDKHGLSTERTDGGCEETNTSRTLGPATDTRNAPKFRFKILPENAVKKTGELLIFLWMMVLQKLYPFDKHGSNGESFWPGVRNLWYLCQRHGAVEPSWQNNRTPNPVDLCANNGIRSYLTHYRCNSPTLQQYIVVLRGNDLQEPINIIYHIK